MILPIGSMYTIYGNIYYQYTPNVSIYTTHGSYGLNGDVLYAVWRVETDVVDFLNFGLSERYWWRTTQLETFKHRFRKWGRRTFSPITSPWERNTKRTNLPFADPKDIETDNKSNMGLKHSQTLCLHMSDPKKKNPYSVPNFNS